MIRRHFSYTFISKMIIFLLSLIQGVFLTRLLGVEGKGLMSFLQANINLLILALGLALPVGVVFFIANKKIPTAKVIALAYLMAFLSLIPIILIFLLGFYNPNINFTIPNEYQSIFFIVYFICTYLFTFLIGSYMAMFSGVFAFYGASTIELTVVLCRLIFYGLFYYYRNDFTFLSLRQIFIADLAFTVITYLLCIYWAHVKLKNKISFQLNFKNDIFPVFRYTVPLYWAVLISFTYTRIDFWIVESTIGLKQLGIYSVAVGFAQLLTFFPTSINSVLYPYLSSRTAEDRNSLFLLVSKINFTFVFLATLVLFFISSFVIRLLYGDEFAGAVAPFKVLVWGYLLSSVKMLFTLKNQINEKLKVNIFSEGLVLLVSVVLNLILIPKFGIIGASSSMVIAQLCSFLFLIYYLNKHFKFTIFDLFIVKKTDLAKILNIKKD